MSVASDHEGMGMSLLPREIFWMILNHLSPKDIIRCRRVSKSWNTAFRSAANLTPLLKKLFPLAGEVRELELELDDGLDTVEDDDYACMLFDQIASRYDHLSCAKPKSIHRYKLCDDFGISGEREWFPVQPWENHASHLMQRVDRTFDETFWSYEDGLVVYPSAHHSCLVLMDFDTDRRFMVPFLITGKVIRRIRLQKRVLVVEWAEPKAFHWLNDSDGVHRHFASSFDVSKSGSGWSVTFRNEWKIMFLGHPLSERDRFYSTHSQTHYAIYIWQPNRSLYTADDDAPIESLSVWDISKPSSYMPSLDPTGRLRVDSDDRGPAIVSRFGFRELGFYSVRQRGLPAVQSLNITDEDQSLEIVEGECTGPMNALVGPAEWTSRVQVTTIPLVGEGPCWRRRAEFALPPYRGNCSLQTSPITFAVCDERWYAIISETYDEKAQVGFCLHLSPRQWPFDLNMFLTIRTPSSYISLKQRNIYELTGKGKICGNENYMIGENADHELIVYRFDR
ncbi:F-box domain protein [Aspergillus sclerotioniger CBS 115572]|uniref:F-box domain protein n=1 Tax=Aspergillus sclerotioniger CBS 115572 TaxID=1450535 RepID=A0A317XC40_9EURO|nr:F-box domain protein [Aspergillus sclerotioniger CBS 115572]PWY95671.1 F-box domain protein [Aspergillus sclerotioniger CBS 115572]